MALFTVSADKPAHDLRELCDWLAWRDEQKALS